MMHFYSSRRKLITCSIIISFILQNCSGFVKQSIVIEKRQVGNIEKASNQVSVSKKLSYRESLYQDESQLQAIGSKNLPEGNLPQRQQSKYGYLGKEGFKRVADNGQEKVNKKIKRRKGEDGGQVTKSKRKETQENREEIQKYKKHLRIEAQGDINRQAKEKKKGRFKVKSQREKKPLIPDSSGVTKNRVKEKRKTVSEEKIIVLDILDLPAELLVEIISYLSFKKIMLTRQLSLRFYEFVTGYNQVGIVGVKIKPNHSITTAACSLEHAINFNDLSSKLSIMPSFIFYQLMRSVKNLPQAYWPYLAYTQIRTIYLWKNKIGPIEIEMLGKCLQRSKVHTVYLGWNQITDEGAKAFGKTLAGNTHIREINLNMNKLGDVGVKGFTEYLPQTMRRINLGENRIEDEGAIGIAKNIKGKEVEGINLEGNKITDEGAIGTVENLQGTIVKILSLGSNKITDEGAIGAAKNIRGTQLEELSLGYNKITNKGAIEIVKGCQGSKIKKLNLSYNKKITDGGAAEIAEKIEGTHLEEIDLRQDKPIGVITQELLKKRCSHIKWLFV
jgi:Ran GTPase-activating protein (RanGAP) involved in mRNA processing and transport